MPVITLILGPTASGKSALAVLRAAQAGGVIINADVMQCYNTLPILTAQPDADDLARVPHQFYSVLNATEPLTAATWATHARALISDALQAGSPPFIVGGTGFYIKALMEGLSPMPNIAPSVRTGLMARLEAEGLAALYADLEKVDPASAARLKAGDTQRIVRALEVFEGTGQPLSYYQSLPLHTPPADWQFHVVALNPSPADLARAIAKRLNKMIEKGALDEVAALGHAITQGHVAHDAQIIKAHGFRPLWAALRGEMSLEAALERTATETRQYTKRQRTWLRHQITAHEVLTPQLTV